MGLTQQALAEAVGVKKATVSGWECGEYEPAPRTAIALTRLLPGLKFEHIYPQGRAAA
jgi:DNA-binding XRE family transcriptional regulator